MVNSQAFQTIHEQGQFMQLVYNGKAADFKRRQMLFIEQKIRASNKV